MDNLHKYKQIPLADFIVNNYGFYKAPGSSQNAPKLTNGGTTVVVNKRNETYFYWDVQDPENKGTIIDFVQNQEGEQNIGKIIKSLDNYLSNDIKDIMFDIDGSSNKDITKNLNKLQKEGNADYLINRGISEKTINSKLCENVIRYSPLPHSTDVAFLMQSDIPNTRAISYRGIRTDDENKEFNFKGLVGHRSQCLVTAFSNEEKKPFDKIFVGESFIDCLSHYELNKNKLEKQNIGYLSTEGSIQPYQVHLLSDVLRNQQVKQFSIISDNDLYGSQLAAYAMGKMRVSNNLEKTENNYMLNLFEVNVPIVGKKHENAYISFNYPKNFDAGNVLKYINDKTENFKYGTKSFKFEVNHKQQNDKNDIVISFPNTVLAWNECFKLINDIKFCSSKLFNREIPISKDFNQDLQDSLNKKQTVKKPKEQLNTLKI